MRARRTTARGVIALLKYLDSPRRAERSEFENDRRGHPRNGVLADLADTLRNIIERGRG
jgi:hypothetical protein